MKFHKAIVRKPGQNFANGISTGTLGAPDHAKALSQHAAYCLALESCGLEISVLDVDERFPDSTFVEDAAVIAGQFAVVTRPGTPSRLGEIETIRPALGRFFDTIYTIDPPGTMDGGDICQAESHFFIGISERTNQHGGRQLADLLERHGYSSTLVDCRDVPGLLHLKSGIAFLGDNKMVMVAALVEHPMFTRFERLVVEQGEEYAANCVRVNERVLVASGFPALQERLEGLGYRPLSLNMSEFQKMDGGLSCLSLRF
jgi:dimethylargininase